MINHLGFSLFSVELNPKQFLLKKYRRFLIQGILVSPESETD